MRKNDEYVIDYACEDGCVKVENAKTGKDSMIESWPGGVSKRLPTRVPRVPIYCAGQVRGGDV